MAQGNRRLYFHGFVFFALAPITGFFIMAPVQNPRAMLSLHLACWLAGAVMCGAAAAWAHLSLSEKARAWTERGLIAGLWIGFAITAVTALLGTKTIFAGGGLAPDWAEGLIKVLQVAITATLVPALIAMAVGLGKRGA